MNNDFFPINLNLRNRFAVIIGGGNVAERKILNLLHYNIQIRVVSKHFTRKILSFKGNLEIIEDEYKKEYLKENSLVFICTNDKKLNLKIFEHARKNRCLVNIATHPELCDFTIPSSIKRGNLVMTISTNGRSPAISKIIKNKLEKEVVPEYETLVEIMGKIREKQLTIKRTSDINRELFYTFLSYDIISLIKKKDFDGINNLVENIFNFRISIEGFNK